MKRLVIAIAVAVATVAGSLLLSATVLTPSADAAICRDGSYSSSYGSGTCSYHGGVDRSYPYQPTYQSSHYPSYSSPSHSNTYHYPGSSQTYYYPSGAHSITSYYPGSSQTYYYPGYGH